MNIFTKLKIHWETYSAQRNNISLNDLIEAKARSLADRAPQGDVRFYQSVQDDGIAIRTEIDRDENSLSDELALRKEMGDIYADRLQQNTSTIIENISHSEMDIRDLNESLREHMNSTDDLLRHTRDYHLIKRKVRLNMLGLFIVVLGEIGVIFILFADFLGLDTSKLISEFISNPLTAVIAIVSTAGFAIAMIIAAEHALGPQYRWPGIIFLIFIALIMGKMRSTLLIDLQDFGIDPFVVTLMFGLISFILPIAGAIFYDKWRDASKKTSAIESALRRSREQENVYITKLREANDGRLAARRQLDDITQEYVLHYQKAQARSEELKNDWEAYARYTESYLSELRLSYQLWSGWHSRGWSIPQVLKKLAQITVLILLLFLFARIANADSGLNVMVLCDRSSSSSEFSCTSETVRDIGKLWVDRADRAGGGTYEIILIDTGFDTTEIIFSEAYPKKFPGPVSAHKRKWADNFLQRLSDEALKFPINKGSAIVEAIHRSSLRIPTAGETIIYVLSDLREFNGVFNFEKQVPSAKHFLDWLDNVSIKPILRRSTRIIICGVHPYAPANTSVMTTKNYSKLLNLWTAVFNNWEIEATITEVCDLTY